MRDSETSEYQCEDCGHKWSGFEWTKSQIKKYNIICEKCESNNIKRSKRESFLRLKIQYKLLIIIIITLISGLAVGYAMTLFGLDFWIGFGIGCIIGLPLFCCSQIQQNSST